MEFVSISLEVITESGRLQNVVQVQTAACDPSSPGCIGNLTSTSMVGLPLESRISLALIDSIMGEFFTG